MESRRASSLAPEVDQPGDGRLRAVVIEVQAQHAATLAELLDGCEVGQECLAAFGVADDDVVVTEVEQANSIAALADGRRRRFG